LLVVLVVATTEVVVVVLVATVPLYRVKFLAVALVQNQY
jgi:hypothetical protein